MALSTREVFLILRARDEASRVLKDFSRNVKKLDKDTMQAAQAQIARGQALSSIGIGLAAAGTAAAAFFKTAVDASNEYTRQAALTSTQTDKVKVSIEQLKDIGREVGASIPTDFDKIQSSLYDIFSSIDVNLPQAKKLLHEFAMESVAGQESLQEAGKGTVGILNAFKIPIKDVRTVSDTMFQLVRKGVGTYQQFNRTIGRAVPSAARAGQSFQSLAGMMAFLTRNGISAAMAAASAGRAMDAISNPKVVGRLEDMGIKVRNAAGEFMPMDKIMTQLGEHMKDMTGPQRAEALQNLFKGAGGTIQARRFFDLAVKNYKQLTQYTDAMRNSKGAMQQAYNTMFKQPQSQAILLSNNIKILKTIVGDALVPAWLRLTGIMIQVVKWFNNLSPHTRTLVVRLAALAAVLTIVLGGVLTIAGAILMFAGAMALAEVSLVTVAATIGIAIGVIAALGVAIFFIIKYHKQIWAFMQKTWNGAVQLFDKVKQAVLDKVSGPIASVIDWVKRAGLAVAKFATEAGQYIAGKFGGPVKEIGGWFADAGKFIATWAKNIYKDIMATVGKVVPIIVNGAVGAWKGIEPVLSAIWKAVVKGAKLFWDGVRPALQAFADAWPTIRDLLDRSLNVIISRLMGFLKVVRAVVEFIGRGLLGAFTILVKVIKFLAPIVAHLLVGAFNLLVAAFKIVGSVITHVFPPLFEMIGKVIGNIINIIHGLVLFITGVFSGDWGKAWEGIKMIVSNIFGGIWNIIKGAAKVLVGLFVGLVKGIVDAAKWLWDKLVGHSIFPDIANGIVSWFKWLAGLGPKLFKAMLDAIAKGALALAKLVVDLAKKLPEPFKKAGEWLYEHGKNFILGLMRGILNIATTIGRWEVDHIINPIVGAFKAAGTWLVQHGKNLIAGLQSGIKNAWDTLKGWVSGALDWIKGRTGFFASAGSWLLQAGKNVIAGFWNGLKEIWKKITDWVAGIATWIKDHKGPISLDGKLLVPAGKAIMQGFLNGLKSGAGKAWDFVSSVGGKSVAALKNALDGVVVGGQGKRAPTDLNGIQALVRTVAGQRGWGTGPEWDALYQLVMHESGFNPNAQNPTSTAYGLFQFLNSTWGSVGASKTSDPWAQTLAGLTYIARSYGDPINAWNAWQSRSPHWYKKGTPWVPDDQLAFVHRGEAIVPYEENVKRLNGGMGNSTNIPITIYTQEIDPRKHAADLGWEISRRVS